MCLSNQGSRPSLGTNRSRPPSRFSSLAARSQNHRGRRATREGRRGGGLESPWNGGAGSLVGSIQGVRGIDSECTQKRFRGGRVPLPSLLEGGPKVCLGTNAPGEVSSSWPPYARTGLADRAKAADQTGRRQSMDRFDRSAVGALSRRMGRRALPNLASIDPNPVRRTDFRPRPHTTYIPPTIRH